MSKHLAKILSICALVVIFPFAILGITLALVSPVPAPAPTPAQGTYVVNYHALDNSDANQVELEYDEETGFEAYAKTRDNYEFVGIKFDGNVYSYNDAQANYVYAGEKLSDALVGIDAPILTAVWECNYPNVYMTFNALDSNSDMVKAEKDGSLDWLEKVDYQYYFVDEEGEHDFDLNDNAYNFFMQGYTNLQDQSGNAVGFSGEIEFAVKDKVGSQIYTINSTDTDSITFELLMRKFNDYFASDIAEGAHLIVNFYYE